ncbi:mucin-2-like isoform X2 [Prorops nasuta]|uniref:mucin-2-like isoform X2 n=1 Tax=Prorops nasuta TaxID=863751 RepID=UPI0034CD2648
MRHSSCGFLGYAVLIFALFLNVKAEGGVACKDLQGKSYQSGIHYIPGPEPCTICVCDNGNPKWCKAFICTFPEEDCKSFRRGDTCCEFICLDDTLSSISNDKPDTVGGNIVDGNANYDLGLRLIASFITAILSMSLLFFLIHRLRQRKIRACVAGRQSRQLAEDQRNLSSMGYIERGGLTHGVPMDDMPCGAGYPLWKPPGNYFPRGEAPPPYEEALAAARAEQALLSISSHTLSPLNFPTSYLSDHSNHTNVAVVTSNQAGLAASSPALSNNNCASTSPLISSSNRPVSSPNTYVNYHPPRQNENTLGSLNSGVSTTSFTMNNINTYENLPTPIAVANIGPQHAMENSSINLLPNSHSANPKSYHKQHTTLPRQSGAFTISASLPNSNISTHRTIPRTLATRNGSRIREIINDFTMEEFFHLPSRTISPTPTPRPTPANISSTQLPSLNIANKINEDGSFESVTCTCSMQALPTLHDDADDYRSECENCKSATGSRYYLDNEDALVTSPHETMTLHRRPEEATSSATPQYYRTSLTLPTSTRQRTRATGVRENWFNTMPQSSTESSDEN